jgi:hypothetical protein
MQRMEKADKFWFASTQAETQTNNGIHKDALPEVEAIDTQSPSLQGSRMYNLESWPCTHFFPGEHKPPIVKVSMSGVLKLDLELLAFARRQIRSQPNHDRARRGSLAPPEDR